VWFCKVLLWKKAQICLNLQGTCDSEGHFLDVCIGHPASTSDYLSFSTSLFKAKLETPGFLAPGLCIFGNNAYVNCSYMATPYKNVPSGSKDNYNHYHSQVSWMFAFHQFICFVIYLNLLFKLWIQIECAFGMLVNWWGILWRALSTKMGLKKTTLMAMCLCRLHNYCINCRLDKDTTGEEHLTPFAIDNFKIESVGGIHPVDGGVASMERQGRRDRNMDELLDAGNHFDDVDTNEIWNIINQHI
jgi:hypothetical protein